VTKPLPFFLDLFIYFNKLQHLIVNGNCFIDPFPSTLFSCKQLQILSIVFNRFTESVPLEIRGFSMLIELYLDNNSFGGMFRLTLID
jgi:LRR receptor-like serine/threonine-protein kinase FLS2